MVPSMERVSPSFAEECLAKLRGKPVETKVLSIGSVYGIFTIDLDLVLQDWEHLGVN
jgi:hypothetical protein